MVRNANKYQYNNKMKMKMKITIETLSTSIQTYRTEYDWHIVWMCALSYSFTIWFYGGRYCLSKITFVMAFYARTLRCHLLSLSFHNFPFVVVFVFYTFLSISFSFSFGILCDNENKMRIESDININIGPYSLDSYTRFFFLSR